MTWERMGEQSPEAAQPGLLPLPLLGRHVDVDSAIIGWDEESSVRHYRGAELAVIKIYT